MQGYLIMDGIFEKVLKKIKESRVNIRQLAKSLNINERTLYRTLSSESFFYSSSAKNIFAILIELGIFEFKENQISLSLNDKIYNFCLSDKDFELIMLMLQRLEKNKHCGTVLQIKD